MHMLTSSLANVTNYRVLWKRIPPRMLSAPDPFNFGCLNQKWSKIRIRISGLIGIWVTAGTLPKCSGFITLSTLVISPRFVKSGWWLTVWQMLINPLKCLLRNGEASGKVFRIPYSGLDQHQSQKLTDCSRC